MPVIQQAPTSTPAPTVTPTPTKAATPTPTATPTQIPCKAGVNLVQNGDFADPIRHYLWVSKNPDIALIHPYVTTPEPNYGLVMGLENSAIQTIHQVITVPPAARSVEIKFWLYVDTYELLPFDYDYLYVDVIDGTSATASSLLHEPFVPFTNRFSPQRTRRQQSLRVDDIEAIKQPVHLQFRATTNWALATEFIIDNVQLITGCQ